MQEKKKQGNLYNLHRIFLFSLINPRARFQEKPQQTLFFFILNSLKKVHHLSWKLLAMQ
jgi:hypothetical protein